MSVQNTDLLLVQRGNVPYRETVEELSEKVRGDLNVIKDGDIPIASASQLGVIRVGNNLQIDSDGILAAVIPSGTEYMGLWTDATTPPTATASGQFWIWEGADATLNNALWGNANGESISDNDRLLYDGTSFDILPAGSGSGGGVQTVTGTLPITIAGDAENPDVAINAASGSTDGSMSKEHWTKLEGIQAGAEVNVDPTQGYTAAADQGTLTLQPGGDTTVLPVATETEAGLMSAADKTQLDSLVSTPGGVVSLTARNGITNNGTSTAPILDVDFGSSVSDPATATVMPYDISMLGELP